MSQRRKLPRREYVFVGSLLRHGFRFVTRNHHLKYSTGYIIATTQREDACGIDFYVKMPKDERLFPIQITQRGTQIYKRFENPHKPQLEEFALKSELRIRQKRWRCKNHAEAFVLVRDFTGEKTNQQIAWGDIKALHYAIAVLRR